MAYPHPLGYDVINYYIPVVTSFDELWSSILVQFPVYVFLLHLVNVLSGLNPYHTVIAVAVGIFGLFAVSLFFAGQKILKLTALESIFLSVFVIVQMAVLRTAASNHRDILALSTLLLAFILIYNRNQRNISWQTIAVAMILSAVTVGSDGMIGAVFVLSLLIYSFITRTKAVILCTIVAVSFFTVIILPSNNNFHMILDANLNQQTESEDNDSKYYFESNEHYNPINMLILFFVVNGMLIPTGVIGLSKALRKDDGLMLALPILISVPLSLSWILFPENTTLVAHRWTIIVGIFLSIFAAYGFIKLIKWLKVDSMSRKIPIASSVLGIFLIIGIGYAIMPHDRPFILFDVTKRYMLTLAPATMQPDKELNYELLSAISWINHNTEQDSTIVGEKRWRGFMQLELNEGRKWEDFGLNQDATEKFSEMLDSIAANRQNIYVVTRGTDLSNNIRSELQYGKVYSGELSVFEIQ